MPSTVQTHQLPHSLPYKVLEMARASDFRGLLDWSFTKGGLIAKKYPANPNQVEQALEVGP
jgi:hypothetical protein